MGLGPWPGETAACHGMPPLQGPSLVTPSRLPGRGLQTSAGCLDVSRRLEPSAHPSITRANPTNPGNGQTWRPSDLQGSARTQGTRPGAQSINHSTTLGRSQLSRLHTKHRQHNVQHQIACNQSEQMETEKFEALPYLSVFWFDLHWLHHLGCGARGWVTCGVSWPCPHVPTMGTICPYTYF